MHFSEMRYQRITYEEIENRYQELFREFETVSGEEDCHAILKKHNQLLADMTPIVLCNVHHDLNVNDPFYTQEQCYYDEIGPKISELSNQFHRRMLESPYYVHFEKILGSFAVSMIRANLESYNAKLISLVQEENAWIHQYSQLVSNGKVNYKGKQFLRNSLGQEQQSQDRETRRMVFHAIAESWELQRQQLERIYDGLVVNRDKQAKALGYKNYVELSYLRMNRIGYTSEDVRNFREQVKKYVVPIAGALHERRKKRLGLEHLYVYDSKIAFLNGNPVPVGDEEFCLEMTRKMYSRLSPETEAYINFMLDNGLYDVKIRDGKCGGGYCDWFESYRSPFIFANFDGTSENAYIMCHEGGHAFYFYLKRDEEIREHGWYTSEGAETHAMAMEFFLAPYMELFFGDRAEDYRRLHLEEAVRLIVYECQQDEFQQIIYEQPQLTRQQRNEVWARLEQEYFPYREYTQEERRQIGYGWQRIPHPFQYPFYAIDYALAQVCALEYHRWMKNDFAGAWKSYLTFCRETGRRNFPDTVRAAGLDDPFQEESIQNLMDWLRLQLNA